MIYHRIQTTGKFLTKDDYPTWGGGFGIDTDLLIQIRKVKRQRGIELHKRQIFDNRTGFAIDMTPFNNTYHELFQFDILDIESGKQLQIDGFSEMNWYGKHWIISAMDKDTHSHRMIIWENETCHDPITKESIIKNKKKYKLVAAETPRWDENGNCIEKLTT